jgi:MoaA/NifB/PqqE/SkfB family radical SAM enzyme
MQGSKMQHRTRVIYVKKLSEVILEISQNCNLDCIMCGFGRSNNDPTKFMSYEDFVNIYNLLGNRTQKIRLNGRGESTIHPDFKRIIEYIGTKSKMSLFTNGNYTDSEINELFIKYDIELYFSMDSPNPEILEGIRQGVKFVKLDTNIKAMDEKITRPFIIFTLQECNVQEIVSIAEYAINRKCNLIYNVVRRDQGIEKFHEIVIEKIQEILDSFKKVESLFDKTSLDVFIPDQISGITIREEASKTTCGSMEVCPNIERELCVLYNGDVTPCNMFNPFVYGNIKTTDIDELLNCENRKWFHKNHKSYYYCKNCACLVR